MLTRDDLDELRRHGAGSSLPDTDLMTSSSVAPQRLIRGRTTVAKAAPLTP